MDRTVQTSALALAACLPSAAMGNIVKADYNSSQNFNYQLIQMPDFDQVRSVFPNTGNMYCVPTSSMNMMAYIATHGLPDVAPGDENWIDWADPQLYTVSGVNIAVMADYMDTDPEEGTFGSGHLSGIINWLQFADATADLNVSVHHFNKGFAPSAATLGVLACQGALINFCYGFYDVVDVVNGVPVVDRDGGHCVTFIEGQAFGDDVVLGVRDPADDGDEFSQSAFKTRKVIAEADFAFIEGRGFFPVPITKIKNPNGSNVSLRILDVLMVVKPKSGFSWQAGEFSGPTIQWGIKQFSYGVDLPTGFNVFDGFNVVEVVASVLGEKAYVMAEEDGALYLVEVEMLTNAAQQVADLANDTVAIEVGRDGLVYCAGPDLIRCLNPLNDWGEEASWVPASDPIAYCIDDSTDNLVGLDPLARTLNMVNTTDEGSPVQFAMFPAEIPLGANPIIRAGHSGGYWIKSDADATVYHIKLTKPGETVVLLNTLTVEGCDPTDFDVDGNGRIFVLCDGSVTEFVPVANLQGGVDYIADPDGGFPELTGDRIRVTRGRTDFRDGVHNTPRWRNVVPSALAYEGAEFVIDCPTDLTGDRVTDSADLNVLLAAFGGSFKGDIDADQDTDSLDLNLLLAAFGEMCED